MEFNKIALIGKYHDSGISDRLLRLAQHLSAQGRHVFFEHETANSTGLTQYPVLTLVQIGEQTQLAIVMGGDGTMLGVARQLAPYGTPLIGINHGRVGFITDIPLTQATEAVSAILQGHYSSEERILLEVQVVRGDQILTQGLALNDVVLSRAGASGMIELDVSVNHQFMYRMRADGLIVATPTGSTAYALSANGPILHPGLRGLVVVPVAPQALSNRPITLPDDCLIEITLTKISDKLNQGASVHFDMQSWSSLQTGDKILVQRAQYTSRFLHPADYSYFATLRHKLHWNLDPTDTST